MHYKWVDKHIRAPNTTPKVHTKMVTNASNNVCARRSWHEDKPTTWHCAFACACAGARITDNKMSYLKLESIFDAPLFYANRRSRFFRRMLIACAISARRNYWFSGQIVKFSMNQKKKKLLTEQMCFFFLSHFGRFQHFPHTHSDNKFNG